MPKLSDTMTEGTVLKWKKKVGESVEIGEVIAEIETDKATMEMEAFDEGILAKILVEEGTKAPTGETLAILLEEGESLEEKSALKSKKGKKEAPEKEAEEKIAQNFSSPQKRIKASPLAKKIAKSLGKDLSQIKGSGPGGRIIAKDVEKGKESKKTTQITSCDKVSGSVNAKVKPLSTMRKIIAQRLLHSKQTIPHFYLHIKVDAENLMKFRKQLNSSEQEGANKFTINDFILKAATRAIRKNPEVNATFSEEGIVQFPNIGIAVAIAIEDGLVTPVIKNAEGKSLTEMSKIVKDLAIRAKENKLRPDEFDGGTVTISNLGGFGIHSFDAIVNPPQALILSVGSIQEIPVVKEGEIRIGKEMDLGVSCDHRVVDGAIAAKFLMTLKETLEAPSLILL